MYSEPVARLWEKQSKLGGGETSKGRREGTHERAGLFSQTHLSFSFLVRLALHTFTQRPNGPSTARCWASSCRSVRRDVLLYNSSHCVVCVKGDLHRSMFLCVLQLNCVCLPLCCVAFFRRVDGVLMRTGVTCT